MDQSPVGALLLDPALRVAWANDTFCDLFDLTRSELIGRGFVDVVRQDLKDLVEEPDVVESSLLEAYASAAEAAPFDFSVRARAGRDQRWIEHTCQVIEKKPLVGGRVAYFVDVTRRKGLAATQHAQDVEELDQILVNLARRSGGPEADEASDSRGGQEEIAIRASGRSRQDILSIAEAVIDARAYELDSFGHVNHAVHLNYFEQARFETLAGCGFTYDELA